MHDLSGINFVNSVFFLSREIYILMSISNFCRLISVVQLFDDFW